MEKISKIAINQKKIAELLRIIIIFAQPNFGKSLKPNTNISINNKEHEKTFHSGSESPCRNGMRRRAVCSCRGSKNHRAATSQSNLLSELKGNHAQSSRQRCSSGFNSRQKLRNHLRQLHQLRRACRQHHGSGSGRQRSAEKASPWDTTSRANMIPRQAASPFPSTR